MSHINHSTPVRLPDVAMTIIQTESAPRSTPASDSRPLDQRSWAPAGADAALQMANIRAAARAVPAPVEGDIENGLPRQDAPADEPAPGLCRRCWRSINPIACAAVSATIGVGGAVAACVLYEPVRPAIYGLAGLTLLVIGGAVALRDGENRLGAARVAPMP